MNGTFLNGRCIGKGVSVLLTQGDRVEIRHAASFKFVQISARDPPCFPDPILKKEERVFAGSYNISQRLLGMGGFGQVFMAWDKKTHRQVACKIVELKYGFGNSSGEKKRKRQRDMYMREVEVLMGLNHPNIINIHKVYSTSSRIYIFEDLITGGDLFSHVSANSFLEETEAMPIVWQILKALEYLHEKGIAHRDLKPDNILCTSTAAGSRIVLTDFGAAGFFTPTTRMTSAVGTAEYVAPEIIAVNKKNGQIGYSKSVDLWSLGIVIHFLFSGGCPFSSKYSPSPPPANVVFARARECNLSNIDNDPEWGHVSAEAKDFIKKLICVDSRKRLTIEQAKSHVWLSRHTRELEEVYQRAVKGWEPREPGKNMLEEFNLSQPPNVAEKKRTRDEFEDAEGRSLDPPSQGMHHKGARTQRSDMSDVPELSFDTFSRMSFQHSLQSIKEVDGQEEEQEEAAGAWHAAMYTEEEDELHDDAARDGVLRSAREFSREVELRRALRQQLLLADSVIGRGALAAHTIGRHMQDEDEQTAAAAAAGERSRYFVSR